jgi:hypothetical protein
MSWAESLADIQIFGVSELQRPSTDLEEFRVDKVLENEFVYHRENISPFSFQYSSLLSHRNTHSLPVTPK